MINKVDINCDMGEVSIDTGKNIDALLMPYISSCNIATGAHAGDLETMVKTMYLADQHEVAIGIHPSYVDREHFGRVSRNITQEALAEQLLRQFDVFLQITEKLNFKLKHCKPHGALYHDLSLNEYYADVFIEIIKRFDSDLVIYAMSGSRFSEKLSDADLTVKQEVFADRRYQTATSLLKRDAPGAVLNTEGAVKHQLDLFVNKSSVETKTEGIVAVKLDTICIHSDTENAVNLSKLIKSHLDQASVEVSHH